VQARLHETVLALRARGVPRGTWRALAQRWRMRVEGGGPDGLPPGLLAQLQPPGVRQDEARAAAQVADSLRRLGLGGGAQWGVLPSGDALCTLDAWAGALQAQQPAVAVGRRSSVYSAGGAEPPLPLPLPLQQRPQQQQQSRRLALLLVGPRHASANTIANDHGAPRASLAPSALRCRALHAAGYRIVAVHVAEWLALGGSLPRTQDDAMRAGLAAALALPAAAMVARPRGPPGDRRSRSHAGGGAQQQRRGRAAERQLGDDA
jgi:hypothetical protein